MLNRFLAKHHLRLTTRGQFVVEQAQGLGFILALVVGLPVLTEVIMMVLIPGDSGVPPLP